MKIYPYQDGDRLIQLVEKRELDQLLERLAEARESHLAASARDVQTIQRQAIMLERLAGALETLVKQAEYHNAVGVYWDEAHSALSAYESANLEPVANPIDEAVKRLSEVTEKAIESAYWSSWTSTQIVRNLFIQAAKGEQP
jgi:hypothetical protein